MLALLSTRVGFVVFIPMLLSISCTNFITVLLAVKEYIDSDKILGATAIFALHYLMPVIASPLVMRVIGKMKPVRILVFGEIFNAFIVFGLLVGLYQDWNIWALAAWISLFGLSETAARSVRLEVIKLMAPEEHWQPLNALAQVAVYLGMAVGGIIIAFYSDASQIYMLLIAAVIAFIVIASIYAVTLKSYAQVDVRSQKNPTLRDFVTYTLANPAVLRNFCFVVLSMAIFQSYMQFGRIIVPLRDGDNLSVAAYQYCILVAFILSSFASGWFGRVLNDQYDLLLYSTLSALFLWIASNTDHAIGSASAFFAYIFFFELVFIISVGRVLKAADEDKVFGVSYLYQVVGGGLIFLFSLLGAVLTDYAGVPTSSVVFALCAICAAAAIALSVREARQIA